MTSHNETRTELVPERGSALHKAVSVTLVTALLVTAPGLPFYQAAADPVRTAPVSIGGGYGAAPMTGPAAQAGIFGLPGGPAGVAVNALFQRGLGSALPSGAPARPIARDPGVEGVRPSLRSDAAPSAEGVKAIDPSVIEQASEGEVRSAAAVTESLAEAETKVAEVVEQLSAQKDASPGQAWTGGHKAMEPLLNQRFGEGSADVLVPASASQGPSLMARPPTAAPSARVTPMASGVVPAPGQAAPKAAGKTLAVVRSVVTMAASAAAVFGVQALGATLLPGAFGLVPVTAAWLVINAVAVAVLYNPFRMRLRLAKSEAQGLTLARLAADAAIGVTLGALAVAAPVLTLDAFGQLPGTLLKGLSDIVAGSSSYGVITPGTLLGLGGLASLSAMAYALPFITGKRAPNAQVMNFFPRFLWLSLGVPFALASGFAAPAGILNYAFIAWNLSFASKWVNRALNAAYAGTWVYAAAVSFQTPLTFLLIMLAADRAVALTTWLIRRSALTAGAGKVAPGDDYTFRRHITHPPTGERIARLESGKMLPEARDPFKYRLKTAFLMGAIFSAGVAGATFVFGFSGFWIPLAIGSALSGLMWFFSHKVAIKMFGGVPYKEKAAQIPRLERIHAMLEARAKQIGLPKTPEFYFIPRERFPGPNAFATGPSPSKAVVAVTEDILEMMDDRELEGVLLHELYHVKHRDILLGSVTGAVGTAISWASYKIMWLVSRGEILISRWAPSLPGDRGEELTPGPSDGGSGGRQVQAFPAAAAPVVFTAMLFRVFASIWLPVIVQLLQMGHTRNREFYADQDAAIALGDGKPLADGLRKLAGFRPKDLTLDQKLRLPMAFALGHQMTVSPVEQFLGPDADNAPGGPAAGGGLPVRPAVQDPFTLRAQTGTGEGARGAPRTVGLEEYERVPGIDEAIQPAVTALETLVGQGEAKGKLGHLLPTLRQILAEGGSVKYGMAMVDEGMAVPALYDEAHNAIVVTGMFRRVDPRLLAVVLGHQLQVAYDSKRQRSSPIKETVLRQSKVVGTLLTTLDLKAMAASLNINNPYEVQLFTGLVQQKLQHLQLSFQPEAAQIRAPSAAAYLKALQDSIQEVQRQIRDLQDELALVQDNLTRKPGDETLTRDGRVLREKVQQAKASLYLASQRLAAFMKEDPDRLTVGEVPNAAGEAPVVRVAPAQVDERLSAAIETLRRRVAEDSVKTEKLGRVVRTLDRLAAEGAQISFGPTPAGAAAFFSPVTLDLIMSDRLQKAHPALLAAVLAHELTHALDYYDGKAMTLETEYNAFTNEAIFMEGLDAEQLARELDLKNLEDVNLFHHTMYVRRMHVQGQVSLQAMVKNSYTRQVWTNIEGLQDASQMLDDLKSRSLEPLQQQLSDLRRKVELIDGASPGQRSARSEQASFFKAVVGALEAMETLFGRQKAQYEAAIAARNASDDFPARPPQGPETPRPPLGTGWFGPMGLTGLGPLSALPQGSGGGGELFHHDLSPPGHGAMSLDPPTEAAAAADIAGPGTQAPRGSWLSRAWEKLKSKFRIVENRRRNRSLWVLLVGQAAIVLGFVFQASATPPLVQNNTSQMSTLSAAGQGASLASNVLTAPLVDKVSTKKMLIGTGTLRFAALALVPYLIIAGHPGFWPMLAALTVAAFVQTTSINAAKVAFMQYLGDDESAYTRAYSIFKLVTNVVSIAGPLLAGTFMGAMDQAYGPVYGPSIGAALAVGVAGVLKLFSAVWYHFFLPAPEGAASASGGPVAVHLRAQEPPAEGRWASFRKGFSLLWSHRYLRRSMYFEAFEAAVTSPLAYMVLALLARDVAVSSAGTMQSFFTTVPVLGWWVKAMTSQSGAYGVFLSAESLGATLATGAMLGLPAAFAWAARQEGGLGRLLALPIKLLARLAGKVFGTPLERQGKISIYLAGLAHLGFWLLLATSNIFAAAGVILLITLLESPEGVVSYSIDNKILEDKAMADHRAKVLGARDAVMTVLRIGGALLIGSVILGMTLTAALPLLAGVMTFAAALHFIRPTLTFPLTPAQVATQINGGNPRG